MVVWRSGTHAAEESWLPPRPAGLRGQAAFLISGIDTDGNGLIDRVEWVNFVAKQSKVYGERGMFKLLQTMRNEMDQKWGLPK